MGHLYADARRNAVSDEDDERGPEATPSEGGLRQAVRDRTNLADSPLAELVRFLRGLSRDESDQPRKE